MEQNTPKTEKPNTLRCPWADKMVRYMKETNDYSTFHLADTILPKGIIESIIFLLYFTPVVIAYLKIVLASSNSK